MHFGKLGHIAIVAAAVTLMSPGANALVINFATGQDGSGNIQTIGDSLDANWKERNANSPKLAPNTYVVSPWGNGSADWYWEWFYNGPNSSWIAPNPDNAFGNGSFTLTFTFDLTGYDSRPPHSAICNGRSTIAAMFSSMGTRKPRSRPFSGAASIASRSPSPISSRGSTR
jgi:hypothetical protein